MGRRSDHSREELKELALAAAERIVDREGQAGLTTRKVAAEIGYTVGTLYLVFRNLDDLMLHVSARTLTTLERELVASATKCRSPEARVLALAFAYVRFAGAHYRRWTMIFDHRLPEGDSVPPWFLGKIMGLFHLLEEALRPLAGRGSPQRVALAARALWGGVHGICALGYSGSLAVAGDESPQALTESLVKNYLAGFTGGKKR